MCCRNSPYLLWFIVENVHQIISESDFELFVVNALSVFFFFFWKFLRRKEYERRIEIMLEADKQ